MPCRVLQFLSMPHHQMFCYHQIGVMWDGYSDVKCLKGGKGIILVGHFITYTHPKPIGVFPLKQSAVNPHL